MGPLVQPDALVVDAARVLRQARIDQVPVVDDEGRPVGLLDVQDLLAAKMLWAGSPFRSGFAVAVLDSCEPAKSGVHFRQIATRGER